ncbi:hypothetical protein B0H15DRAFT_519185 [Mycena belliarum]|uniref:DUF6533 domain-containing protein n=1 Tax=Mycena belliarum TaxID=1033014 RepID=A0AAD6TVN4_9AGAR|nr:hypothetical protein B0H15DRAFT_519185 [Mycena belliae]
MAGCQSPDNDLNIMIAEYPLSPPHPGPRSGLPSKEVVYMDPSELTAQHFRHLQVTRYFNAAAFVMLIYDHLLTLGAEVDLIWTARLTAAKATFLVVRYMVPCALTFFTNCLDLLILVTLCRWWMSFAIFMGWATLALSNFLILLRLWVVWDRQRKLSFYTLLSFVVAEFLGLVAASLLVWQMKGL